MEEEQEERSRPSTPKWWRPPIPPETYMWEEVRRQRRRGGYPWTLLDKDEEDDDDMSGDNLYEPVNPPPLYGTGSGYMSKDRTDTGSLDGRMIDIPPDIEILTSEGLDGLDQPDPHDSGVDGDKEWHNFHGEEEQPSKAVFTAGIRNKHRHHHKHQHSKVGETAFRPLTNKSITFAPEVNPQAEAMAATEQEVPSSRAGSSKTRPSALEQLKTKAELAAGQVRQRISKISIPVRPKFNNWTGIKLVKKKSKDKRKTDEMAVDDEEEQEVPDGEGQEPLTKLKLEDIAAESVPELKEEPMEVQNEDIAQRQAEEKAAKDEELKRVKAEEKAKKEKGLAEEKARKEKEQAEEKARKEKEQAEEKLRKQQEQEEAKRVRAEEKLQKEKAKEELKKQKAEEKLQKQKLDEEAKKAKAEEELRKTKEQEDIKRIKAEEEQLKTEEMQLKLEEELMKEIEADEAEEMDVPVEDEHPTKSAPTKKKKKVKKSFMSNLPPLPHMPQLPQMPHIPDIDFKKRFIRSKTPPPRPSPPKPKKLKKSADTQNQLAAQYESELRSREEEIDDEQENTRLREPQIYVTQPSVETESELPESHTDWSHTGASGRSEEFEEDEDVPSSRKQQPRNKEKLEKIGKQLKGFGIKSKAIASQKSKDLGQKMKVIGKDLQKFGVKVNEKYQATIDEIKAKQDAAKQKSKEEKETNEEGAEHAEMEIDEYIEESEPRTTFRFRRRTDEQEQQEQIESPRQGGNYYENSTEVEAEIDEEGEGKFARSQLLGRADRDWESPLDLVQSRDASEEPFSGNVSSRDSPPGSSMASSSMHVRRQGVLEEIDSDEFFLRERGISEGEDEEEVNRFLVEELRQAFRPTISNALTGFDLPTPPSRPSRSPRKPPRKEKDNKSPNFQTFPPERPKRKQTPGYVSSYINEHGEEEQDDEMEEQIEDEIDEEGIQRVKEELRKIEQEDEENKMKEDNQQELEYEDGRYEPVSEEPAKPERTKRAKPKLPTAPQTFYYNTIAANEWMRDLEDQVVDANLTLTDDQPVVPKRERRKSEKSGSLVPEVDETELRFNEEEFNEKSDDQEERNDDLALQKGESPPLAQAESESRIHDADVDLDDTLEYVDEAGYAVVHKDKDPPKTIPRKKRKGGNSSKGNSLKRKGQQPEANGNGSGSGSGPLFFSLPRYTPRTFHIVPPTRPHRTYSTLRPKRPPRNKSKSNQNLVNNTPLRRDPDEPRPSTAIGIMQGRPLPPPPRPERSPAPLNDLDQTSIERSVGIRHYANFEDDAMQAGVVEEVFTATNIPMLGGSREEDQEISSILANSDINVAVQTDPVQEDDYELNNAITSFEEDDSSRIDKLRNSASRISSDDQERDALPEKSTPAQDRQKSPTSIASAPSTEPAPELSSVIPSSETDTALTEPELDASLSVPEPTPSVFVPEPASVVYEVEPVSEVPIREPIFAVSEREPIFEESVPEPPPVIPAAAITPPVHIAEPIPTPEPVRPPPVQAEVIFPTRLHLSELEVDVLRVNDLSAHSITVDNLQAPHLQVNSLTSTGALTVSVIQAQNLNSDQVNCNKLSSDTVDLPSIPPPSFYQLASPEQPQQPDNQRSPPQELSLEAEELEDNENESSCPCPAVEAQLSVESLEDQLTFSIPDLSPTSEPASPMKTPVADEQTSSLQPDPDSEDIVQLSMRLGRALLRVTVRGLQAMADYIDTATSDDPAKAEEQRANMQVLLCLVLVLVAGIILSSRSGPPTPRWEFYMPPPDL